MSEDVLYADVKFKDAHRNAKASSSDDTTYSEIKIVKVPPPAEPDAPQQDVSNKRSRVTERVVLCVLLAAAVIGLGVVISDNVGTKINLQNLQDENYNMTKNLQTLQDENESLKKNLTDKTCPKCEACWEQHGGKFYYFSISKSSWEQSREDCRLQGGDLVKIDSREEQEFLERRVREKMNAHEDRFWIGLTDSKKEGTWLWVDDSPLDTSLGFWAYKQPDDWKEEDPDGEDCVRMGNKEGATDLMCWFDRFCKASERRICEKPA